MGKGASDRREAIPDYRLADVVVYPEFLDIGEKDDFAKTMYIIWLNDSGSGAQAIVALIDGSANEADVIRLAEDLNASPKYDGFLKSVTWANVYASPADFRTNNPEQL